jgi:quinol monooxygenase YgiN
MKVPLIKTRTLAQQTMSLLKELCRRSLVTPKAAYRQEVPDVILGLVMPRNEAPGVILALVVWRNEAPGVILALVVWRNEAPGGTLALVHE